MGVDADSRDDEARGTEARDGESRDGEVRDSEVRDDEEHPTEEEQVEREWHFWLFAILALGGVVLIFFPPDLWPDAGFALVAVAVVGWILKTITEKSL